MRPVYITYIGFTWVANGLVICYLTSLFNGNLDLSLVPMISDIASLPPGGGMIAMVMNWYSFFTLLHAYIFYRYFIAIRGQSFSNTSALFMGIMNVIGVSMAGCFEVRKSYLVHYVGAFLTFSAGFTYSKTNNGRSKTFLSVVRWSCLVAQVVASSIFTKGFIFDNVVTHPVSTAEWIMVYSFVIFILTMSDELTHIRTIDLCLVDESRVSNGVHKRND